MAKRRKKTKTKGFGFRFGKKTTTRKIRKNAFRLNLAWLVTFLVGIAILAAVGAGFFFLEKYVNLVSKAEQKKISIELVDVPAWVTDELRERILNAAYVDGRDKDAAEFVQKNLSAIAWLENIKVQTDVDGIRVFAGYRKPIASLRLRRQRLYLDANSVVLDYMPMPKLAIVEIKGVRTSDISPVGSVWLSDAANSAIALLKLLDRMDQISTPQKPLLFEVQSIDISNLGGRKDTRKPHIILHAMDATQIYWGAEVGMSQRYMEATEKEKLAMLYAFYAEHGTLQSLVKYIELRRPQKTMPQPINNY